MKNKLKNLLILNLLDAIEQADVICVLVKHHEFLQPEVKDKLIKNELVAMTSKNMTSTVYSFGRDHGHFGRILNQTVMVEDTLHVKNEHEIYGFCFTPQDGNSILSSISAAEHFLYPHSYEDKIQCLNELFFEEI